MMAFAGEITDHVNLASVDTLQFSAGADGALLTAVVPGAGITIVHVPPGSSWELNTYIPPEERVRKWQQRGQLRSALARPFFRLGRWVAGFLAPAPVAAVVPDPPKSWGGTAVTRETVPQPPESWTDPPVKV